MIIFGSIGGIFFGILVKWMNESIIYPWNGFIGGAIIGVYGCIAYWMGMKSK